MKTGKNIIPLGRIEDRIFLIRGQRVMIDADLADLYGVETKRLNEQARRNSDRFPEDFMFQLTPEEKSELVANCDHLNKLKYSPSFPLAFTEHGAIMLANILNSNRAIAVSVYVVRAFVKLREALATHKELAVKLAELERKVASHDQAILALVRELKKISEHPEPRRLDVGFKPGMGKKR